MNFPARPTSVWTLSVFTPFRPCQSHCSALQNKNLQSFERAFDAAQDLLVWLISVLNSDVVQAAIYFSGAGADLGPAALHPGLPLLHHVRPPALQLRVVHLLQRPGPIVLATGPRLLEGFLLHAMPRRQLLANWASAPLQCLLLQRCPPSTPSPPQIHGAGVTRWFHLAGVQSHSLGQVAPRPCHAPDQQDLVICRPVAPGTTGCLAVFSGTSQYQRPGTCADSSRARATGGNRPTTPQRMPSGAEGGKPAAVLEAGGWPGGPGLRD